MRSQLQGSGTLREHAQNTDRGLYGLQRSPRRRLGMSPQRVHVFALGTPKPGTEKAKRRWVVRWRVEGRDRMRKFASRAQAERLRSELLVASSAGHDFDLATGLPAAWVEEDVSFLDWACQWLELKWPGWAGNTRRAAVEVMVAFVPHMIRSGAPQPPLSVRDLRAWLYAEALVPNVKVDSSTPVAKWFEKHSLALSEIGPVEVETALRGGLTRLNGKPVAASTAARRKNMLSSLFKAAVRRELMASNPVERIEWRNPMLSKRLDVATVPSVDDVRDLANLVWSLPRDGSRYAAVFDLMGFAGLRPSEVSGVEVNDLQLPNEGWGIVRLRRAVTNPGERYARDTNAYETKELKHRASGDIREVPIPPETVARLQRHMDRFPPRDGSVFLNADGNPIASAAYSRVFKRARAQLWPEGHKLAKVVPYDLRHSAATIMLRAGVPPAEVAIRLGHSVDMLMKVYAGVFDGERERSNALIDAELGASLRK